MRKLMPIILLIGALVIGAWIGWKKVRSEPWIGPTLRVDFIDAGEGDSIFILTPDGASALIDAGDEENGAKVVEHLRRLGVHRVDLMVLTHPDSNHVGGAPAIFEAFSVTSVLDSGYQSDSEVIRRIIKLIHPSGATYGYAKIGMNIPLGQRVKLEVLGPPENLFRGTGSDANNNSIVVRLVFGKVRMLLTGDIEKEAEGSLIANRLDLESQVLKVANLGSRNGTSLELLRLVRPQYIVISEGAHNRYGYLHKSTLERIAPERTGAVLLRTDENGTITFLTDGRRIEVEKER